MFDGRLPGFSDLIRSEETILASQSQRVRPLPTYELPPFIRLLQLAVQNAPAGESSDPGPKYFITNVAILHDAAFSPKSPLLGAGHHFSVYASPFEPSDQNFIVADGRAFNNQVYCLKIANFSSPSNDGASGEFRDDYYHTVLQECRVLLHPKIREAENIIGLFGLDFHEDYDDYKIAWPVMVMEYAEYGTLDTFQEDFEVTPVIAREFLLDIARGLDALHQCNIIHGDVKSENVVICCHQTRKYVAKLSDFGLAVINPDPDIETHRLPGGTPLWTAPEYDQPLTVDGLKQTDIYSYGLLVWRLLVNDAIPYNQLALQALGMNGSSLPLGLETIVPLAKSNVKFAEMILITIQKRGLQAPYAREVIEASVKLDPSARDLARVISGLTDGQQQFSDAPEDSQGQDYWDSENPANVLEQLANHFPTDLIAFAMKSSVLYTLHTYLTSILESSSEEVERYVCWLLFQFGASPFFPKLSTDVEKSCQILKRLCSIDSLLGTSITAPYYRLHGKDFGFLESSVFEHYASIGSLYGLQILKEFYPEIHERLLQGPLSFERTAVEEEETDETSMSEEYDEKSEESEGHSVCEEDEEEIFEEAQDPVIQCIRKGDFEGVKSALVAGNTAYQGQEGMPSALHWLVSFEDKLQIDELVPLLLENGAILDAWEGDEESQEDYLVGRVVGTPLHWAIWYRNLPLVRALTRVDLNPEGKHVDRALNLAASIHLDDVLEILRDWVTNTNHHDISKYDWNDPLLSAINNLYWLPRLLRHGLACKQQALERTLDIIISMQPPSEEQLGGIFHSAVVCSNTMLLRYLFLKFKLKDLPETLNIPLLQLLCIGVGNQEIFDILLEQKIITPDCRYNTERFNPLQCCMIARQRNPYFLTRLLDIGCPVDAADGTGAAALPPFGYAVAMGLYDLAIVLLEYGADKDYLVGWAGGYTIAMQMLVTWRDIPISRLKFLLEDIPRLGFGHISFYSWPGIKGNLLYGLCLNPWAPYTAGYRLGETAKYIISNLADKSCLSELDLSGCSALRMATASGNLDVMQALIVAGIDVNAGIGFTPLASATEWLGKCQARFNRARRDGPGSERRLSAKLCDRAQKCVDLLKSHGGFERNLVVSALHIGNHASKGWNPLGMGMETLFEMVGYHIQGASQTRPGTLALNPTAKKDFKIYHGQKSITQKVFGKIGQGIDAVRGEKKNEIPPRWQAHECWPWRNDNCIRQDHDHHFRAHSQGSTNQGFPFQNSQQTFWNPKSHGLSSSTLNSLPSTRDSLSSFAPASEAASSRTFVSNLSNPSSSSGLPYRPDPPNSNSKLSLPPRPSTQTTNQTIEKIRNTLFTYFLESVEAFDLTLSQRQSRAIQILSDVLQLPISLASRTNDIGACTEYFEVKTVIEDSLEALAITGVGMVPELSERTLFVHVCGIDGS